MTTLVGCAQCGNEVTEDHAQQLQALGEIWCDRCIELGEVLEREILAIRLRHTESYDFDFGQMLDLARNYHAKR